MKYRKSYAFLGAALLALPQLLQAQPTAHYAPGTEGLKAASLPPPGIYLRDYNAFYYAETLNDSHGNSIPGADPRALVYANVPRLLWITDMSLLGGSIGFDALLPLQYTDLSVNTPGGHYSDSTFGIGDVFAEVTWSAHSAHWDFALGYGFWAPTGDSSSKEPSTDAGLGYWGQMITAGATFYPDKEKKWAISALNRYEINMVKDGTDFSPGDAWTIEGGISRALSQTVDLGVVGYYQMQMTKSSGDTSGYPSASRDKVAGIGPEISVFYPRETLGWSLRYLYEFMSENRLQGHTVMLTITKRF
jgi:hypothetical protein